jgi:carbonic anhydrase
MTIIDQLIERNAGFAERAFNPELRINPTQKLMVICCVDPRVDPTLMLGVGLGEAAVIRNVGGRVTPATIQTMGLLSLVGKANGGGPDPDWNLVVLHHTDCGMTDLAAFPDALAPYFGIGVEDLGAKSVSDPYGSVKVDVDILRHTEPLASAFQISGLVYDVDTGLVEIVVPAARPTMSDADSGTTR